MTTFAEGSETGAELGRAVRIEWDEAGREVLRQGFDPVHRPAHYASGAVECADAIEAALHGETDATVGWCRGNAIKYLWRSGKKDDTVQDLRKAIWYIERAIRRLEARDA